MRAAAQVAVPPVTRAVPLPIDDALGRGAPDLWRPVPWQDSLLLPMFAVPAVCVAAAAGTYYGRGALNGACPNHYTASTDNEISEYLCCEPEYWFGLVGLCVLGGAPSIYRPMV